MQRETMVGFGYKQGWLAIRDGDPLKIVAALGLRDLGPASWRTGIDMAYLTDDRLAVTPPLPGAGPADWVLVTGQWLMQAPVDIADLSVVLDTEVQHFSTHRVVEAHSWRRAVGGRPVRAFGYLGESGEILTWLGEPDATELSIGLPADVDDDTSVLVGEDDVMAVARAWSVDPTSLDRRPAPGQLRVAATGI